MVWGGLGQVGSGWVSSCQVRSAAMKPQPRKTFNKKVQGKETNTCTDIATHRLNWPRGKPFDSYYHHLNEQFLDI